MRRVQKVKIHHV